MQGGRAWQGGVLGNYSFSFSFFKRFYLFIFKEQGREGEREGEKHRCARETLIGHLLHAPNQGPGLQPRHEPRLGIGTELNCLRDDAQPTGPHQSGLLLAFLIEITHIP